MARKLPGQLKVRYLPEGGFGNAPAFVEYEGDSPPENATLYQHQDYLRLNIECCAVQIHESWELTPRGASKDGEASTHSRRISARGEIGKARWGRFSLSFMGKAQTHDVLEISIHRSSGALEAYFFGNSNFEDLNVYWDDSFSLVIYIGANEYDALEAALVRPGAKLHVSVDAGRFRKFFAPWSPSVSDGRTIKFLETTHDIENADEVPEETLLGPDLLEVERFTSPVDIRVVWSVGEQTNSTNQEKDDTAPDPEDQAEERRFSEKFEREVQSAVADSMRRLSTVRLLALAITGAVIVWAATKLLGMA